MEKAAALADSRLFLPASTRDACVQEQAVLLLPTTQQPTKNKQLPDNNYLLRLQLLTATSTAHGNFNCLLQQHTSTATTTTHWYNCLHQQNCNYSTPEMKRNVRFDATK
jgi:hypothetical protein